MAESWRAGFARMQALVRAFPKDLRTGYSAGSKLSDSLPPSGPTVVLAGMGGSAIAGDLAFSLADREGQVRGSVIRGPVLPAALDPETLVVLTSYSGNTWETLATFDEAGRRGLRRVAVSSGGELAERARQSAVPHLAVPPGYPPRAAVGHLLGGLLGTLGPRLAPELPERFEAAVANLEGDVDQLFRTTGPAARFARSIGPRQPFFYAEASFAGLARRWKTQVEENAKRMAHYDAVPELFHNAIVPWDALSPAEGRRYAVVNLEWPGTPATTRSRFDYLDRLLKAHDVRTVRIRLVEPDYLASLFRGIWLGDAVSLWLARNRRVDPYRVDAIETMKRRLAGG